MSIIEIFNPNSIPYGSLSNNFRSMMTIDNERWTSVTQYIYSNMLTSFLYRDKIKNTPLILLFSSLFTLLFTFLRNFDIASIILVTSLIKVTVFNLFLT